jgi:hypothetical protein
MEVGQGKKRGLILFNSIACMVCVRSICIEDRLKLDICLSIHYITFSPKYNQDSILANNSHISIPYTC